MKASLNYVVTKVGLIRTGYIVMYNKRLCKIISMHGTIATINYKGNDIDIHVKKLRDCVIKFLAITNTQTYPIIHGCACDILERLKDDKLHNAFVKRNKNINILGNTKKILVKPNMHDIVTLIDFAIIEKYNLHDIGNQIGVITDRINPFKYIVTLNNQVVTMSNKNLELNRSSFTLIGKDNYKILFDICN